MLEELIMLVSRDHGDNRPGPDPIFRPPPGVKPNPIDPPTRGQQIVVTGIILTVITISFVVARLSVKRFIIKKLSFDDCKASVLFFPYIQSC